MKQAPELIPWKVFDISVYPYGTDYWPMNPSIHLDKDGTWRCVTRIVDYAMPDGVTIRSRAAGPTGQQTRNAMVIFDPISWKPIRIYQMRERDSVPRVTCPHAGYEDMRIFRTDKGGLQGIAAALHLRRGERVNLMEGSSHQPPEQVLLSFDDQYDIVAAQPIRGGWSGTPQKNWVPFDHCEEPRFLYSIGKGTMFGSSGSLHGDKAVAQPSRREVTPVEAPPNNVVPTAPPVEAPENALQVSRQGRQGVDLRTRIRGGDIQLVRGRRALDAMTSRPSRSVGWSTPQVPVSRAAPPSAVPGGRARMAHAGNDAFRVMGGRTLVPKYEGLRGGTQLLRVGEDSWLGIGHEMKFVGGKKFYWHVFYLVDSWGQMTGASVPMKFAPNGIEFAAGMAIDGERVVVSFGVDDMKAMLGETKLSAVLEAVKPL